MAEAPVAADLVLSVPEARRIAYQASFGRSDGAVPVNQADCMSRAAVNLERLGYVQLDTISVVERAHHHILWSRDREYRPSVLPALEGEPRQTFEYWAHAAAYLPLSDYRYCLPRMRRIAVQGHEWFASDRRIEEWVLNRIRAEGPLRSQDFESNGPRGPWWDWKPAKAALEYLFQSGELMVAARPGFQKLYDLTERVLPAGTDTSFPSEAEMGDWYVRRALSALGIFTLADIAYQRRDGISGIVQALDRASEAGRIKPCIVRGAETDKVAGASLIGGTGLEGSTGSSEKGKKAQVGKKLMQTWCATDFLAGSRAAWTPEPDSVGSGGEKLRPVRILSPFDNLIINRKRASRVFGLEYTIECYVPAKKRRFGYFALPVFYRDQPVGLIDCKADRKLGVLQIKNMGFNWGPDPVDGPDDFAEVFKNELASFAAFNNCADHKIIRFS